MRKRTLWATTIGTGAFLAASLAIAGPAFAAGNNAQFTVQPTTVSACVPGLPGGTGKPKPVGIPAGTGTPGANPHHTTPPTPATRRVNPIAPTLPPASPKHGCIPSSPTQPRVPGHAPVPVSPARPRVPAS